MGLCAWSHLYTDGSFKEADGETEIEAAWAFVVILEHTSAEYCFYGFAAGSLAVGNCYMRAPPSPTSPSSRLGSEWFSHMSMQPSASASSFDGESVGRAGVVTHRFELEVVPENIASIQGQTANEHVCR